MQEVGIKYIFHFIKERAKEITGGTILSGENKTNIIYNTNELDIELSNIVFLDTSIQSNSNYNKWYASIIEKNIEHNLDNLIQLFDKNIDTFRIVESKPKCRRVDNEKYYNLNEFGDGLGKFISFICLLQTNKNGYIFIDEIENGIHYSKLDMVWKTILTISKQQNVQVFATTHSKECIESYARVAKRLEDEEIAFIELGINKYNKLDSIVMNSERFQRFIKLGNEVRGW